MACDGDGIERMVVHVFGTVAALLCGATLGVTAAALCVAASGPTNEHARMLGREVAVYDLRLRRWVPCVVICVSWHGSVRVRRQSDGIGFWVDKSEVPTRVVLT